MANYTDIVYGTTVVHATNIVPIKVPATVKQKMGKAVAQIAILGRDTQDWTLTVTGKILGTTATDLGNNRAALEALDNADIHGYADGIHDGNYIIEPGTLQFTDEGQTHFAVYSFTMRLIQKQ